MFVLQGAGLDPEYRTSLEQYINQSLYDIPVGVPYAELLNLVESNNLKGKLIYGMGQFFFFWKNNEKRTNKKCINFLVIFIDGFFINKLTLLMSNDGKRKPCKIIINSATRGVCPNFGHSTLTSSFNDFALCRCCMGYAAKIINIHSKAETNSNQTVYSQSLQNYFSPVKMLNFVNDDVRAGCLKLGHTTLILFSELLQRLLVLLRRCRGITSNMIRTCHMSSFRNYKVFGPLCVLVI